MCKIMLKSTSLCALSGDPGRSLGNSHHRNRHRQRAKVTLPNVSSFQILSSISARDLRTGAIGFRVVDIRQERPNWPRFGRCKQESNRGTTGDISDEWTREAGYSLQQIS